MTLRRMLSHESGLATEPPGTDWSVPVYPGEPGVTLADPDRIVLMTAPNAQHKYSDLGYQLLGEIVTRVSGIPYPRYRPGIWPTTAGPRPGASPGAGTARTTPSGFSTPAGCRATAPACASIQAPASEPSSWPLLGLHARPDLGGWVLRLEWRDGQLVFTRPDLPSYRLALEPTDDPDGFIAEPGSSFAGENVVFRRRTGGGVVSVLLVQSTLVRLAASG